MAEAAATATAPCADRVRGPEAPGDKEAGGGPEFLFDIGLDAAAAKHRQPAEAIGDADDPDAADQPGDQGIGAERGERDRKHEDARADDRPDDDALVIQMPIVCGLLDSLHRCSPGLGIEPRPA